MLESGNVNLGVWLLRCSHCLNMGCYCVYRDHQLYAPGIKVPSHQDAEITTANQAPSNFQTAARRKEVAIKPKEVAFQLREFRGGAQLHDLYSLAPVLQGSLVVAEGVESRRKYLVHVMKQQGGESRDLVEKLRELDHPNILRVMDVVKENGSVCVVYENCEGKSAFDLVRKTGPQPDILSLCIIRQVLAALRHCHAHNFLLRNLSLAQVLFLDHPSPSSVQIKLLPYDDKPTSAVAPEAMERKRAVPASDLYSAGLILAQLLLGEADAKSAKDRCLRNSSKDWANVDSQVKALIFALLAPESAKRPSLTECFHHPWISSWSNPPNPIAEEVATQAVRNLGSCKAMSRFKQVLLTFVFNQMYPEAEMKELQLGFRLLDEDLDGEVSGSELLTLLLRKYSKPAARGYFSAILKATGMPASGRISFADFLIRGSNKSLLVAHLALTPVFHMLDRENRGRVSVERLKEFVRIDEDMDEDEEKLVWAKVVAEITTAKEGISFNDFCVYLRGN